MRQTARDQQDKKKARNWGQSGALGLALLTGACDATLGGVAGLGAGDGLGTGAPGAGSGSDTETCIGDVCSRTDAVYEGPGEVPMRRLNNAEYANTMLDLLGTTAPSAVTFPAEGRTEGFDTVSTALAVSPLHIAAFQEAAEAVVAELFASDPGGIRGGWCDYATGDEAADLDCARTIASNFAALAWRRPLSAWPDGDATADYLGLLEPAGVLSSFPLQIRLETSLEAVLLSSRFIYRMEFADSEGNIDSPSMASRLSYFLWSSAPDAGLLSSDLLDEATLQAEAERAESDPRFDRFVERFPDLWLELEKLDHLERDAEVYPDYTPALAEAMTRETVDFVASYIRNPSLPVRAMLTASTPAPTDPGLAEIYGDSPRLGLLTQAAVMTLTGISDRTSPVRRGLYVLERILCEPPPPPPEDVIAMLTEDLEFDEDATERERLAIHRVEPSCAGCHITMDAIGLGFENYDALGAYRETYASGVPIDPSGVLPGSDAPFADPIELVTALSTDERISRCAVRQLLTYGAGRTFESEDDALVEVIERFAGGSEASFSNMLTGVILSDGFRRRQEVQ